MKKIPTIFDRDWDGDRSRVLDKPHPDCAWVFAGEGHATRKIDGTSCMVRDGKLYKRREIKKGQTAPQDFEVATQDEETGKTVGWVPVGDGPEDKYHREAFTRDASLADGTYELVGPNIQGNPEGYTENQLVPHTLARLMLLNPPPLDFEGMRAWFGTEANLEGVVWHHPDGRMAKIKARDFGVKRAPADPKFAP